MVRIPAQPINVFLLYYKHLYHFLNLHLFPDGEESTTNFLYINYSSSLTNINVPTQYRVLYYSTLLIIISFVYTAVHTCSLFISACTLSCEKNMCFLLLTHYTIVNQLIMYHDILLELCVLYIYSCTQEKVIHHKKH